MRFDTVVSLYPASPLKTSLAQRPLRESRTISSTSTHKKERQANQCGIRGHEEKKAEKDPDTKQRHPQRRLHGTHAHPCRADSGHLAPLPHASLSWSLARLVAWRGGLITPPWLLGVHGIERAGHPQHEKHAQPHDVAHDRFHGHSPIIARE